MIELDITYFVGTTSNDKAGLHLSMGSICR